MGLTMKILVTGSRYYSDRIQMDKVLDEIGPFAIVHGAAKGADSLASEWAQAHQVEELPYPAQWSKYGRSAGPIRNEQMLNSETNIELVVAFPLKTSIGTWHMVNLAKARNIPTRIII